MGVFKRWREYPNGSKIQYWYIRYAINGKIKWEAVGKAGVVTKDVALRRLAKRKQQIQLGQQNEIGATIPTLREFSNEYLTYVRDTIVKRSCRRDEISVAHLNGFFGNNKLSAITPKDILDYQGSRLKEGKKPATVNRE